MSGLQGLPENVTEVGNVYISVVLGEDGPHTAFGYDGLSPEAAIGHLTVVIDRLRRIVAEGWDEIEEEDDDELSG